MSSNSLRQCKPGAVTEDGLRQRRKTENLSLRKKKRTEHLMKRRLMMNDSDSGATLDQQLQVGDLGNIIQGILSQNNLDLQRSSIKCLRRLLSRDDTPPINEVIKFGAVPVLVGLLSPEYDDSLRREAAWVLTNICAGSSDQTRVVVDCGALPCFIDMMMKEQFELANQALWAIGNIAGDSVENRELVINSGGIECVLFMLNNTDKIIAIQNCIWTISNLCRGKNPAPDFNKVSIFIPALVTALNSTDPKMLADASWALSYLSDGDHYRVEKVLQANCCSRVVNLLASDNYEIIIPVLRCIGCFTTGDDRDTQEVLDSGCLSYLHPLLLSQNEVVEKETCWVISNITAGIQSQIQEVIDSNIVAPLVSLMRNSSFRVQREACWATANAISGGSANQVVKMVESNCVSPLCFMLTQVNEVRMLIVLLHSLEKILTVGKLYIQNGLNPYALLFEECEGHQVIQDLQSNETVDVHKRATRIILKFFHDPSNDTNTVNLTQNTIPATGAYNF